MPQSTPYSPGAPDAPLNGRERELLARALESSRKSCGRVASDEAVQRMKQAAMTAAENCSRVGAATAEELSPAASDVDLGEGAGSEEGVPTRKRRYESVQLSLDSSPHKLSGLLAVITRSNLAISVILIATLLLPWMLVVAMKLGRASTPTTAPTLVSLSPPPDSPPPSPSAPKVQPAPPSPSPSAPPSAASPSPPPLSPPPSPPSSPPPGSPISVAERINRRYRRAPFAAWAADGALPDAGVLVHCFDGHAQNSWLAPADCADIEHGSCLVSASMIFSLQNRDLHDNPTGREASDSLFACPGGIVFRPGVTIVQCGAPGDCGGYCHQPCPSLDDDAERTGPSSNPDSCTWAVDDIGIYLERETNERRAGKYRNNGYNEFLVRGDR